MKAQIALVSLLVVSLSGCMSAMQHQSNVGMSNGDNLTVGKVQREIRIGMAGAEVASVMGSPNIVTTDAKRREVWVYDKVATDYVSSSSTGWVFAVLAGGKTNSGASSTTQRTLTVIVKFDESMLVRDFAYHTSKF